MKTGKTGRCPLILAFVLWGALSVCGLAQTSATLPTLKNPSDVLPGYKLAWSDEFEGEQLDAAKWNYRTDSKHWSTQKPENVSVADGKLRLTLRKEKAGGKEYTGAGVISKDAFQYGFYEARMKVPVGAGWHTSFWMQRHDGSSGTGPKTAYQELDVIENDSIDPNSYGVNVHKWKDKHLAFGGKKVKTTSLSQDFHVFGCEFTSKTVKYFFDGNLVQTVDVSKIEHGDQNIWLTSIASHLGGTKAVDDAKLPGIAEYDYVRFFKLSESGTNAEK
jgi:beta-glucanase (GH16 family)